MKKIRLERANMVRTLAVVAAVLGAASGINPYEPTAGWLYALEAAGRAPWPDCSNRFLSVDNACAQDSVALDSSTNSPGKSFLIHSTARCTRGTLIASPSVEADRVLRGRNH